MRLERLGLRFQHIRAEKSFLHTLFLQHNVTSCNFCVFVCVLKLRVSGERDKGRGIQAPAVADQEAHWPFCILARQRVVVVPTSVRRDRGSVSSSLLGQFRERGKPCVPLEFLSGTPPPATQPSRALGPLRLTRSYARVWKPKKKINKFCLPSHPALKISPTSAFEESALRPNKQRRPSRIAFVPKRQCVITPAV